jgi:hypothetical protein
LSVFRPDARTRDLQVFALFSVVVQTSINIQELLTIVGLFDVDAMLGQSETEVIHGEDDSVPVLSDWSVCDLALHPGPRATEKVKVKQESSDRERNRKTGVAASGKK